MDMKDIAPGMLLVDSRGKLAVVTAIDLHRPKNPVVYKTGAGRTAYIGPPGFFRASVGTVDLGKFETAMTVGTREPVVYSDSPFLPPELNGFKLGDPIKLRRGHRVETVVYLGYNHRAPNFPVRIRRNGREYRCPLSCIVRDGADAAKRSEKEIKADIAANYARLSPENLTGDGELPRSTVEAKSRALHADLQRLFKELGREVSEEEAFAEEHAERA